MNFLIIFVIVFFLGLLIFHKKFRKWVRRQLITIKILVNRYFPNFKKSVSHLLQKVAKLLGMYSLVVIIAIVVVIALIILAVIIKQPIFTAIVFILSILTMLIVWMPAGLLLKLFGLTKVVVPRFLKTLVASLAFLGFLLLFWPDLLSFKLLLGLALFGFITFGLVAKVNVLDKIIYPLIVVMLLILSWQYFFPEDFNSSVRYVQSWNKKINAGKRRASLKNETVATTTYAILLQDVSVLYVPNGSQLDVIPKELKQGLLVRVVSDRDTVITYDGQGFIQIQLPNDSGSFVGGGKYLIEAPYIQIASPREVIPERKFFKKKETKKKRSDPGQLNVYPNKVYSWDLEPGEETPWLKVPQTGSYDYSISSNVKSYTVIFSDGTSYRVGRQVPCKKYVMFKVKADTVQTVYVEIN